MDHQGGPLRNSQAYADIVERKWGMQREHVGALRLARQREGIGRRDRSRGQGAEGPGQHDRRRPGREMTSPAAHARRQHAAGDSALAGIRQHANDLRYAAIDFRMADLIRVQNVHSRPTNLSGHPTRPTLLQNYTVFFITKLFEMNRLRWPGASSSRTSTRRAPACMTSENSSAWGKQCISMSCGCGDCRNSRRLNE